MLEALAIWAEQFEPTHPRIGGARKTAVKMYEALGRPEDAARYRDD